MRSIAIASLLTCALLVGCRQTVESEPPQVPQSAVALRLSLSASSGHVDVINSGDQPYVLYRDALSLSVSGKTEKIPQFPRAFPPEKPVILAAATSLTWRIVIRGNEIYPYDITRGGVRLLEDEHHVKAVYHCIRSPAEGQSVPIFVDTIESNEVVLKMK